MGRFSQSGLQRHTYKPASAGLASSAFPFPRPAYPPSLQPLHQRRSPGSSTKSPILSNCVSTITRSTPPLLRGLGQSAWLGLADPSLCIHYIPGFDLLWKRAEPPQRNPFEVLVVLRRRRVCVRASCFLRPSSCSSHTHTHIPAHIHTISTDREKTVDHVRQFRLDPKQPSSFLHQTSQPDHAFHTPVSAKCAMGMFVQRPGLPYLNSFLHCTHLQTDHPSFSPHYKTHLLSTSHCDFPFRIHHFTFQALFQASHLPCFRCSCPELSHPLNPQSPTLPLSRHHPPPHHSVVSFKFPVFPALICAG